MFFTLLQERTISIYAIFSIPTVITEHSRHCLLFHGHVHQTLAGVLPGVARLGVQHVLLIVLLCYLHMTQVKNHLRGKNLRSFREKDRERKIKIDTVLKVKGENISKEEKSEQKM